MSSQCPACGSESLSAAVGRVSASRATEKPHDSYIQVTSETLARYHRLSTTNVAPEGAELAFVQSVVSRTSHRLAFLDREIARLQDQLKELKDERDVVSSYHAKNVAILSPLRRMPPEVLGEIFSWCASDEEACKFQHMKKFPWILTQISRRWRAVSISTPSLWSLVGIQCSGLRRYSLPLLQTQIGRARKLKVRFYGSQNSDAVPQIALLQYLAEHSSVWEELSIGLTSALWPLLATLRDRLPSLRRLWIQWDSEDSLPAVESIDSIDAFHTTPLLSDVTIYNEYRHIPILLPAHRLTRYDLDGPWAMHQEILKMSQNLVEARITLSFHDGEPWPPHAPIIRLLQLRRLYTSHSEIIDYLEAPTLQEIVFIREDDEDVVLPYLEAFLARSACNPRRLGIRGTPDVPEVLEILQRYPYIIELVIILDNPGVAQDNVARALMSQFVVPTPSGTAVSPQLSVIDFAFDGNTDIDPALYLTMLRSRWRADDCALKAATIVSSRLALNLAILEGLEALRKDGLNFLLLLNGLEGTALIDAWTFTAQWA